MHYNRLATIYMDRWDTLRNRVEQYLGPRSSERDRAYTARRKRLAESLDMGDSTLKGFLPTQNPKSAQPKSVTLGLDKVGKLLAMQDFEDLRSQFPELAPVASPAVTLTEIQLEIDSLGFDESPELSTVRLPISKEGRVRLTITKSA
jgi:hypothetical protein